MTDNIPGSLVSIDAPHAATDTRGRPLLDLRISVMDRCNFRCPYCMPRETYGDGYRFLPAAERLSFEEILRLARAFAAEGVRKVRLTGGEPLLRTGLADLVGELSAIEGIEDLALTTNGVLLAQHAAELAAQGLARVTVSLDSIDPATFRRMNGGFDGLDRVLDGIRAAREAGLAPVKVNAVVQRGVNDGQVLDLARHFRGSGVVVRFIEYMDVGNRNHWQHGLVVPSREIRDAIGDAWALRPLAPAHAGEVAERYAYADGAGEIGFISSVTQPFCGGCTRARLSSDGVFYTCLFATEGTDLRAALRAGADAEELRRRIRAVWRRREDRYSELRELPQGDARPRKIEMYYIGG
ncbi:MAG TPA: GTP 3',8-cyclase MoaA [Steroidobacteraceae bacterium]|jgi:cyclic pyranopterin phosphate synthase|nr:GTP 3',8-cyclase MoaA [Steroidobacteraceae bacterium]